MILLAVVIVSTLLLLAIFALLFKTKQPPKSKGASFGSNSDILRALSKGSDQELKEVVDDPRLRVSVIQLQHLGLIREERRRRNRKLLLSLADFQAKSFVILKRRLPKEISMRIIEDFEYEPTCMNNLKEAMEDRVALIKKKCRDTTSSTQAYCLEKYPSFQVCSSSRSNDEEGILLFLSKVVRVALSYIDLVKDLTLTVQLLILIGFQALLSSYFTLFQSTIVWLMIFSVGAPLLMSAIQATIYYPTTLLSVLILMKLTAPVLKDQATDRVRKTSPAPRDTVSDTVSETSFPKTACRPLTVGKLV